MTIKAKTDLSAPSFMVYVHDSNSARQGCGWSLHSILPDRSRAVRRAQTLFSTGRYARVEVKQRRSSGVGKGSPIRILEQGGPRFTSVLWVCGAVLAGVGFMLLTVLEFS